MRLCAAGQLLEIDCDRPAIMGIVNVGDDSVADPLRLWTLEDQLRVARAQITAGAAIIDIGAQSGRTDTEPISVEHEIELLRPLVEALADGGAAVSVDTWRAPVAEAAVHAGAAIINDVSGLADPDLAAVAAQTGAALVLMHTRAAPKTASFPGYEDPVADVKSMLQALIERALTAGVQQEQLILDPGLDFAKTPQESIDVLRRLPELQSFGRPLLLAVSRKYFLGMLTGRGPVDRLAGTLAAVSFGVDAGAQIVRVHDVEQTADFLAVRAALAGQGPVEMAGDPADQTLKWLPPKLGAI
ncbi:MAG TPA: dihydropteroate synthase [Solirubrobacteraceae bacterium]|jgi:dihydropteroate synthase|nr:dihydropteroate synthase [Solirubrobacteraceae bacterium]